MGVGWGRSSAACPAGVSRTRLVRRDVDGERLGVEEADQELGVGLVLAPDGGLAELALGHVDGNVGAHDHSALHPQRVANDVRDENEPLVVIMDALEPGVRIRVDGKRAARLTNSLVLPIP